MLVGVFLNDADDFLSNTAKYNALLGDKSQKTSKLANLKQISTVFGLENPIKDPTHAWRFFPHWQSWSCVLSSNFGKKIICI